MKKLRLGTKIVRVKVRYVHGAPQARTLLFGVFEGELADLDPFDGQAPDAPAKPMNASDYPDTWLEDLIAELRKMDNPEG